MENFYEVYDTPAEVTAFAKYSEARLEFGGDNPDDDDLAPTSCACPKCGERNIDNLLLDPSEVVTCLTCGEVYDISGAARLDRVRLEDVGFGDDYGPNFWNMQTAERAGAFSYRCD